MGNENFRYYQFGDFKIDSRRRLLFKNGERIDISSRNFDLLYVLIKNEGRILSHDELLDTVWSGTFVEQSNLKKGISALRHLLEESPDESMYIRTVPRQGYSFVATVIGIPDEPPEAVSAARISQTEVYIEEVEEIVDDDEPRKALSSGAGSIVSPRKYMYAAIAVALIAVAAYASWSFLKGSNAQRLESVRIEKLSSDGECYGRMSPDGNFVACTLKDEEGNSALEMRQITNDSRRRIISLPKTDIYATQFAQGGSFIVYVIKNFADNSKSGIHRISVLGGEPKFLVPDAGSVVLASDGRMLFSRSKPEGGANLIMTDAEGRDERVVASFSGDFRIWDFKFSPGEKAITVSVRKQLSDIKNVFYVTEIPLGGGAERILVPERDTLIASATWMPDGGSLLLCIREKNADIRQIWQYFLGSGEMVRLTNDNTSYKDVQILKDGKTISAVAENFFSNVWIGDAETYDFRPITSGVQSIDRAFWLPDGRLGYAAVENSAEVIRIMAEDGRSRERVNEGKDGYWIQPSLSGGGKYIAHNSNRSGLDQLWRIGIDGRDPVQLTRADVPIFNGRLLSDGTAIYKISVPSQGWMLMELAPNAEPRRLNMSDIDVWDISPDEKLIATIHDKKNGVDPSAILFHERSGENRIVKTIPLKPGFSIDRLIWDRDSNGLTFVATDKGISEVFRIPVEGGEPKKISNFRHERVYSIDWSFDSKKLALVRGRAYRDPVILRNGN